MLLLACAQQRGTHPHDMSAAEHTRTAGRDDVAAAGAQSEGDPSELRERAGAHRNAAAALVEAERRACAGLGEDERTRGPFSSAAEIAAVTPLVVRVQSGKVEHKLRRGAVVVIAAQPGLTVEWIERLASCHMAHAARRGHDAPDLVWSPLAMDGIDLVVDSAAGGFSLAIETNDEQGGDAVLARAQALLSAGSSPSP